MRPWWIALLLVGLLATLVAGWSPQDREIFALRDAVQKDIGTDKTFYDWLNLKRTATDAEIAKAYRKMSQKLHPDKNPSKAATARFSRLGLVAKVLRSEGRERYDFFLDYGFPRWKGTDYYYSRYRPGLFSVLVFLFLLSSTVQYWFKKLTASQHRKYMNSIIEEAKDQAWSGGFPSTQRKVTLSNGKAFMVYPTGSVTLIDGSKMEFPLDPDEIPDPTWRETILFTLPSKLYYKVTGKEPPTELRGGRVLGTDTEEKYDGDGDKPSSKKTLKPKPAQKIGASRKKK